MALTVAGEQLTDQHRRRQLAIRAAAVRDVQQVWAGFDLADIDRSWRAIAPGMEAVARDYASQSARQARDYFQAFRTAEGVPGEMPVRLPEGPPREALRYSLGYYGQIVPKKLVAAGRPDVSEQALTHMAGGVSRHALNGGRQTVMGAAREDRRARGWARVTAANPCAFCAMLANRGAVYRESTANFRSHDHCACFAEPAY